MPLVGGHFVGSWFFMASKFWQGQNYDQDATNHSKPLRDLDQWERRTLQWLVQSVQVWPVKHNNTVLAILMCWSWPKLKSQFGQTCVINVRWNGFHTTSDFDLSDTSNHLEIVGEFISHFLSSHYQHQSGYKQIGIFLRHLLFFFYNIFYFSRRKSNKLEAGM